MIASRSIFAQGIGLEETAAYLKELFAQAGAEVIVDKTYAAPFVLARFNSSRPAAKTLIFIIITIQCQQIMIKNGQAIPLP